MVVAINQPRSPISRQALDPRSQQEKTLDQLLKGLTIANQGFGLAVNFQKFQNLPSAEEAKEIRFEQSQKRQADTVKTGAEIDRAHAQAGQFEAQAGKLEAETKGIPAKLKQEGITRQAGIFEGVNKEIRNNEQFKIGQNSVFVAEEMQKLGQIAKDGNVPAKEQLKVALVTLKQPRVSDADIQAAAGGKAYLEQIMRFAKEKIDAGVRIEDVEDLLDVGKEFKAIGMSRMQTIRAGAVRRAAAANQMDISDFDEATSIEEMVKFSESVKFPERTTPTDRSKDVGLDTALEERIAEGVGDLKGLTKKDTPARKNKDLELFRSLRK